MKLYAEIAPFRARQLLLDGFVISWIALWTWVGIRINELVNRLAAPARTIEQAGRGFARPLEEAGSRVAEIPLVGEALREPFEASARAGSLLAQAGADQQAVVHTLALWLGLLFALVPIAFVIARYLPARVRWVRAATAAQHVRSDEAGMELFALRAVATLPLHVLRRATPDPARAWATGDHAALAALELGRLGLRAERSRPP
jgi:hypothetical protein